MIRPFDIIIPVSYKDCGFLKKNIPYIRENLYGSKIYIITNEYCFRFFSKKFLDVNGCELIDENKLYPGLNFTKIRSELSLIHKEQLTGWYFQQFLKFAFSLTIYAKDFYLIWDSDTVPIRAITFFKDCKFLVNPKNEHHQPYFDCIEKLLKLQKYAPYSFISEHMMIKTSIMKELILKIEEHGCPFWRVIINACDNNNLQCFSEFETYGNYCYNFYQNLFETRKLTTLRSGSKLFGRCVTRQELSLLKMDFDTVSFERGSVPPFPRSIAHNMIRAYYEIRHKFSI